MGIATAGLRQAQSPKGIGWLLDFEEFARALVHIRTKDERVARLKLNPMQQAWMRAAQGHRRTITLKARQHGISTMIESRMYWKACTRPGYRGVIIAQDTESTARLRAKIALMYEMHGAMKVPRPKARYDSRAEMVFDLGTGKSTIYIGTAGSRAFGRGDTISEVHASELAFWGDPERIMTGLAEAVPEDGEIHIESTPNGFNVFHEMCQQARMGQSGYELIFLPWYVNPEYQRTPGIPHEQWTDDERAVAAKAALQGITLNCRQVAFRREKQRDLKGKFLQEYAEDMDTCFLLSGRPRFDNVRLSEILAYCTAPIHTEQYTDSLLTYREWEKVEAGELYVIGADASQGLSAGDNSIGRVTKWSTGRQVAELGGKADPFTFAIHLDEIGRKWNNAVMNPERKESGIAVVAKLEELRYPRMFYYTGVDGKTDGRPGLDTNTRTRPLCVDAVAELIDDNPEAFCNAEEVGELMRFVINESGKAAAEQGAHDDRVAALWCAEIARQQTRPPRTIPLERRKILGKQI